MNNKTRDQKTPPKLYVPKADPNKNKMIEELSEEKITQKERMQRKQNKNGHLGAPG